MSKASFAGGATLKMSDMDEAEATFNPIGEITDIGGPSLSADAIETTHLQSPDDYREFVGGLKDGGEVNIDGNFIIDSGEDYDPTDILDHFHSGDVVDYEIEFPNTESTTWSFAAIVTAFETNANYEDTIGFSATFKITGKPTLE